MIAARYKSATEFAVAEIRRLILNGELQQSERVDQVQIAERLGISRLPVRQAMERLAERGFIQMIPHKGATVAPLSTEDMDELYAARERLEVWAIEDAWPNYSEAVKRSLGNLLERSAEAIRRNSLDDFMELNREFHLTMFAPSANRYLKRMIEQLFDISERYQRTSLIQPGRMRVSDEHHRAMLRAIEAGNLERLTQYSVQHNAATKASVMLVSRAPAA
jgi:DNA-binding GntR family transcriptional regulator